MTPDPDLILALTDAMRRNGLTRLELDRDGATLRLTLPAAPPAPAAPVAQPSQPPATVVRAPGPGHFLPVHPLRETAPARVAAGDCLGYLQIGDVLRPVTAPVAGAYGAPRVAPCDLVGAGDALFDGPPHATDEGSP